MNKFLLAFGLLLACCWPASATYTVLQMPTLISNGAACGSGGSPCTYANPNAFTVADFETWEICWNAAAGTISSVTGSVNATGWNLRATSVAHDTTNAFTCEIVDAQNASSSGTETISVVFSGGVIFHSYAWVTEITGVSAVADPGDQFSGQWNSTASTTFLSASITTTGNGEIVLAQWNQSGASNVLPLGWTLTALYTATTTTGATAIEGEFLAQPVAAAAAPTITSASSTQNMGLMASYLPATAGPLPYGTIGGKGKIGGNGTIGMLIARKEERC
jgi:hypothetical protein